MSNTKSKIIYALIIFILVFMMLNTFAYIYKHQNELIENRDRPSADTYIESLGSTYNGLSLKEVANAEADKVGSQVSYIQQLSKNTFEVGLLDNTVFNIVKNDSEMLVEYPTVEEEDDNEE